MRTIRHDVIQQLVQPANPPMLSFDAAKFHEGIIVQVSSSHPPSRPDLPAPPCTHPDLETSTPSDLARRYRQEDSDAAAAPSPPSAPPHVPSPHRNHRFQTTATPHCHKACHDDHQSAHGGVPPQSGATEGSAHPCKPVAHSSARHDH